jgi:hypothetical protein
VSKRAWLIFATIQIIGSILAAYGTTYAESVFVRGSWLVGFLLLFPGNLPGLAVSAALTHSRPAYVFFPVSIVCNAITWLTTRAVWRMFRGQVTSRSQRYGVAFFITIWAFGVVNTLHFLRPVTCSDCFFPYGFPFTLYRNGSNAGGGGLVLRGIAADAVTIVAIGLLLGAFWQYVAAKRS